MPFLFRIKSTEENLLSTKNYFQLILDKRLYYWTFKHEFKNLHVFIIMHWWELKCLIWCYSWWLILYYDYACYMDYMIIDFMTNDSCHVYVDCYMLLNLYPTSNMYCVPTYGVTRVTNTCLYQNRVVSHAWMR